MDSSSISRRRLLATGALAGGTAIAASNATTALAAPSPPSGGVAVRVGRATTKSGLPQAGYNIGHCYPGGNTRAWLDYAGINVARFFASFTAWCPDEYFRPGTIADVHAFDRAIDQLRDDPGASGFVDWTGLIKHFRTAIYPDTNFYNLAYELGVLTSLGIDPLLEAAELRWNRDWTGLFLQYLKHYALTSFCAREFGVTRYNFVNEPDYPTTATDLVDQDVYVRGLQIASSAIKHAVDDVKGRRRLTAMVQAPVITHSSQISGPFHMDADPDSDARDDQFGWGQITLLNRTTDYHGNTDATPIVDVYDTHLYNKTADVYTVEIAMIKNRMGIYSPGGKALPISYSEFNRHNTSTFETADFTLDTPRVVAELAEIWPAAMTAGADQLVCFKFDNTVRSNGIPYGTGNYTVSDAAPYHVTGTRKSAEANRLFATRFTAAHGRRLAEVTVSADGPEVRDGVHAAIFDTEARTLTLWLPQTSTSERPLSIDLSAVPHVTGRTVLVEEVSATLAGGVAMITTVPRSGQLTLIQPAESVWRLTVLLDARPGRDVATTDAVAVSAGSPSSRTLAVRRDPAGTSTVSYVEFDRGLPRSARAAVLELIGSTEDTDPLTFRVYGLLGERLPRHLSWSTAPHLDRDALRARSEDDDVIPLGLITVPGSRGVARLDVSALVARCSGPFTLMLIRERAASDDTADDGRTAHLGRPRLRVWS